MKGIIKNILFLSLIIILISCKLKTEEKKIEILSTYPQENEIIKTNKILLQLELKGELKQVDKIKIKLNDKIISIITPKESISMEVELAKTTNKLEYLIEYTNGNTEVRETTFFYIPEKIYKSETKKKKGKYKSVKAIGIKKYEQIKEVVVLPEIQNIKESIYISNIQLEILNKSEYIKDEITLTYKITPNEEFKNKILEVIKEIRFEIRDYQDSELYSQVLKEPSATLEIDTSKIPSGSYISYIKVKDVSNRNYEESKWIKIDKTPPKILLSEISNNTIVRGIFDFYAKIVDEESGIDNFKAEINGKEIPYSEEKDTIKFSIDSTQLKNGTYTITIIASDKLTNTSKTNISILIDNWVEKTVDKTPGAGFNLASFLDSDGNIHIAYYNILTKNLYYAFSKNLTNWRIELVDKETNSGKYPSIFVDKFNRIHISYTFINEKWDDEDLRYALNEGGNWKIQTLDQQDKAGRYTSIVVDDIGIPHISYYNYSLGGLRYMTYNLKVGRWEAAVPDSFENVGSDTSIGIFSNIIHIVYLDNANGDLKHCWKGIEESDANWKFEIIDSEGKVGYYANMKIDSNGNIHVSYYDSTKKALKYAIKKGNSWQIQIVDKKDDPGRYTSIFVDREGNPHISYFVESKNEIRYAYFNGKNWNIQTVVSDKAGGFSSIIFKDKPIIFFYDQKENNLKLATK
ncbi:MAG: Ig-like domain-containing protein [Brevinematia bacterium]